MAGEETRPPVWNFHTSSPKRPTVVVVVARSSSRRLGRSGRRRDHRVICDVYDGGASTQVLDGLHAPDCYSSQEDDDDGGIDCDAEARWSAWAPDAFVLQVRALSGPGGRGAAAGVDDRRLFCARCSMRSQTPLSSMRGVICFIRFSSGSECVMRIPPKGSASWRVPDAGGHLPLLPRYPWSGLPLRAADPECRRASKQDAGPG